MSGERVLVVGGCGFVGYHIVRALLEDKTFASIYVASRSPTKNLLDGVVEYLSCDLTDRTSVTETLKKVKPTVIVNCASPAAAIGDHPLEYFLHHNLDGTRNLFEAAVAVGGVHSFVYTSSFSVHTQIGFVGLKEDAPVYTESTRTENNYAKSKALTDTWVLAANGRGSIQTCSLRVSGIYGERDGQVTANALELLRNGRHKTRIGSAALKQDYTSVENVAQGHVLAVKALTSSAQASSPPTQDKKVAGEAFFITDNDPLSYFDFCRIIWRYAGDTTPESEVREVPGWFILNLASLVDWITWLMTFGQRRPEKFRRYLVEYVVNNRTCSIEKARTRLGYEPYRNREDSLKRGVEWLVAREKSSKKDA